MAGLMIYPKSAGHRWGRAERFAGKNSCFHIPWIQVYCQSYIYLATVSPVVALCYFSQKNSCVKIIGVNKSFQKFQLLGVYFISVNFCRDLFAAAVLFRLRRRGRTGRSFVVRRGDRVGRGLWIRRGDRAGRGLWIRRGGGTGRGIGGRMPAGGRRLPLRLRIERGRLLRGQQPRGLILIAAVRAKSVLIERRTAVCARACHSEHLPFFHHTRKIGKCQTEYHVPHKKRGRRVETPSSLLRFTIRGPASQPYS